ncbi:hypothetical protein OSB04_026330 [Centaurea solstitialis]|uniref:BUB1 N-terminal domain-containing protein n=1 Tax=Centaurea solstitialis TaxID=347529 RepID=A0AA38W751_9ASTR|nr:hypothetical protein OSB04_026330 [Centaurea solstitialis]
MANKSITSTNDNLFSSLISDIKTYNGSDPLLPWLRGIRTMTDALPSQLLKQKLPRFLQKCAQTFETDLRYRNDLRYLRVWIKLLDFVDEPGAVLKNMKANRIGNKRSLFYQAYALYYEKMKKFSDAEQMYHLGVQNLAEPADELQKAFDQFLHRMERHQKKRIQRQQRQSTVNLLNDGIKDKAENILVKGRPTESLLKDKKVISHRGNERESSLKQVHRSEADLDEHPGDNTVVLKFAKTAIVGKSKAEDARHHGLVEPTINTKEAMDAINSMFREPLGPEPFQKHSSHRSKENGEECSKDSFKVFNDDDSGSINEPPSNENQPMDEPFQIYCDDDEDDHDDEKARFDNKMAPIPNMTKGAFVFPRPKDIPLECSKDSVTTDRRPQAKFKEDTVVFRFVGSTISDEPKVENACHHGLVEPTVNLKEAMDDINSMFGKPIEFVRKRRPRKQEKPFEEKQICSSFLILPDDDNDHHQQKICQPNSSSSRKENDLFEQTVCTKEAMDDINKMFAMPLDF